MNMKNIKTVAEEYNNSVEEINKKIRSLQSKKSRLKKQKSRDDYEQLMREVLTEEQVLKEARDYLEPKKQTVTTMTDDDIALLTYDETVRAIKSIQSKKCLTQFDDPAEYQLALEIEQKLKDHRETVKEHSSNLVKKSRINDIIHHLASQNQKLDKDYVVNLLQKLIDEE